MAHGSFDSSVLGYTRPALARMTTGGSCQTSLEPGPRLACLLVCLPASLLADLSNALTSCTHAPPSPHRWLTHRVAYLHPASTLHLPRIPIRSTASATYLTSGIPQAPSLHYFSSRRPASLPYSTAIRLDLCPAAPPAAPPARPVPRRFAPPTAHRSVPRARCL